jgi:hypothetical protein
MIKRKNIMKIFGIGTAVLVILITLSPVFLAKTADDQIVIDPGPGDDDDEDDCPPINIVEEWPTNAMTWETVIDEQLYVYLIIPQPPPNPPLFIPMGPYWFSHTVTVARGYYGHKSTHMSCQFDGIKTILFSKTQSIKSTITVSSGLKAEDLVGVSFGVEWGQEIYEENTVVDTTEYQATCGLDETLFLRLIQYEVQEQYEPLENIPFYLYNPWPAFRSEMIKTMSSEMRMEITNDPCECFEDCDDDGNEIVIIDFIEERDNNADL